MGGGAEEACCGEVLAGGDVPSAACRPPRPVGVPPRAAQRPTRKATSAAKGLCSSSTGCRGHGVNVLRRLSSEAVCRGPQRAWGQSRPRVAGYRRRCQGGPHHHAPPCFLTPAWACRLSATQRRHGFPSSRRRRGFRLRGSRPPTSVVPVPDRPRPLLALASTLPCLSTCSLSILRMEVRAERDDRHRFKSGGPAHASPTALDLSASPRTMVTVTVAAVVWAWPPATAAHLAAIED